ncbi:MAG: hypothetical protein IRY83_11430 [Chloroflexi bacterium]|nr:hypothetical protein [Chloroflexota bacterium]
MATPTTVAQAIERDLHRLRVEIEDLPTLAEEWADAQDSVRYDAELTWHSVMVGLRERLDPAYRSGQMTPKQAERYRALLQKLREALPIIARLGFLTPHVPLEP